MYSIINMSGVSFNPSIGFSFKKMNGFKVYRSNNHLSLNNMNGKSYNSNESFGLNNMNGKS